MSASEESMRDLEEAIRWHAKYLFLYRRTLCEQPQYDFVLRDVIVRNWWMLIRMLKLRRLLQKGEAA